MHSKSSPRRRHSDELKAQVLAACDAPGASISAVALAHGLNTNLVRKWRSGHGVKFVGTAITPAAIRKTPQSMSGAGPEFVAVQMSAPALAGATAHVAPRSANMLGPTPTTTPGAQALIQIELRRGPLHLNVRWPASAADDCTAWLRELSAGLLK